MAVSRCGTSDLGKRPSRELAGQGFYVCTNDTDDDGGVPTGGNEQSTDSDGGMTTSEEAEIGTPCYNGYANADILELTSCNGETFSAQGIWYYKYSCDMPPEVHVTTQTTLII